MQDIANDYISELTGLFNCILRQSYPMDFLKNSLGLTEAEANILPQFLQYFIVGYCICGIFVVLIHFVREQKPLSGWGRQLFRVLLAGLLIFLAPLVQAAVRSFSLPASVFGKAGLLILFAAALLFLVLAFRKYIRMYGIFGLPHGIFEAEFAYLLFACYLLAAWNEDYRYYFPAGVSALVLLYLGRHGSVPKKKIDYYV